jgi:hypothetical protein
MGTGPPLVTTVGITPFHFCTAALWTSILPQPYQFRRDLSFLEFQSLSFRLRLGDLLFRFKLHAPQCVLCFESLLDRRHVRSGYETQLATSITAMPYFPETASSGHNDLDLPRVDL